MDIYTGMGQVDWDWMQMIWKKMRMDTCQLVRQAAQDRTGSAAYNPIDQHVMLPTLNCLPEACGALPVLKTIRVVNVKQFDGKTAQSNSQPAPARMGW